MMLSQLLRRAGHSRENNPYQERGPCGCRGVRRPQPDVVCLSALPPYAMSYARALYEALHARQSNFDIVIGLWNYSGDLAKAAKVITGEEGNPICVTLAEAVERVSLRDPSAKPERKRCRCSCYRGSRIVKGTPLHAGRFHRFLRLSLFASRRSLGHAFKLISDSQNVASLLTPVRFMEQNGTPDELQSSRPHRDKVTDYGHL